MASGVNGGYRGVYDSARMAAIDERVTNLSGRLNSIDSAVAALSVKLDAMSTAFQGSKAADWKGLAAWASVILALMGGVGGVGYVIMNNAVTALDRRITVSDEYMRANLVPRVEHKDRNDDLKAIIVELKANTTKNTESKLDKEVYVANHVALQREVNDLRAQMGNTWNLRDGIQDMRKDIDRLRDRLMLENTKNRPYGG